MFLSKLLLCVTALFADGIDVRIEAPDAGLAVVPVMLNGRGPYSFIVDTGATGTMLDASIARQVGLVARASVQIVTPGGTGISPTGRLDTLSIGGLLFSDLDVSWMPLDTLRRMRPGITGVLGQDVLSRLTVSLDYARGRLRLASDGGCQASGVSMPITWGEGRPLLGVREEGSDATRSLVLDSAASAVILFRAPSANARITSVDTHAGSRRAAIEPEVSLGLGPATLRTRAISIEGEDRTEDGLLPTAAFERVCIDGPGATAVLGPVSECGIFPCRSRTARVPASTRDRQ